MKMCTIGPLWKKWQYNDILSSLFFDPEIQSATHRWSLRLRLKLAFDHSSLLSHSAATAVSVSVLWASASADSSRFAEHWASGSSDASAGSSGKAEYIGMELNMTKPTVMTINEMMYRTENWNTGSRRRVQLIHVWGSFSSFLPVQQCLLSNIFTKLSPLFWTANYAITKI